MITQPFTTHLKRWILFTLLTTSCPSLAIDVHCSDFAVQQALSQIKAVEKKIPPAVIRKDRYIPNLVHEIIYTLSVDNFEKINMALKYDKIMLGPSTDTHIINFNPELLNHYTLRAKFPQQALQFVLAHEMAHRVQSLYFHHINKQKSVLGYELKQLPNDFEKEVYPHAETDCIALSLMKNARMKMNLEQAYESQILIRSECAEYRGPEFCQKAFEVRFEHMKKWLESPIQKLISF